jgi:transposase InsO family protein
MTYLRSPVRGVFFCLYLIVDVWSRKIVGWSLRHEESSAYASEWFSRQSKERARIRRSWLCTRTTAAR